MNMADVASQIQPWLHCMDIEKQICNLKQIINRPPIQQAAMSHQPRFSMLFYVRSIVMATSADTKNMQVSSRVRDTAVDSTGNRLGNESSKVLCSTSFNQNLRREVRYRFDLILVAALLSN